MTDTAPTCGFCLKPASEGTLKRCSRCQEVWYCSAVCQRIDFKTHKEWCKDTAASKAAPALRRELARFGNMRPQDLTPWTMLNDGMWLHGRHEWEVCELLIDSYRLREITAYERYLEGEPYSINAGEKTDVYGFIYFLKLAESRPGLMPSWWTERNRNECVTLGAGQPPHPYFGLDKLRERHEIVKKQGGGDIGEQLLMFAEQVYKRGPGDEDNIPRMKEAALEERSFLHDHDGQ